MACCMHQQETRELQSRPSCRGGNPTGFGSFFLEALVAGSPGATLEAAGAACWAPGWTWRTPAALTGGSEGSATAARAPERGAAPRDDMDACMTTTVPMSGRGAGF